MMSLYKLSANFLRLLQKELMLVPTVPFNLTPGDFDEHKL